MISHFFIMLTLFCLTTSLDASQRKIDAVVIHFNNESSTRSLLVSGPDGPTIIPMFEEEKEEDDPLLIYAARLGHVEGVTQLLNEGADIDVTDDCDCTAMIEAAEQGHHDVVHFLFMQGANPYKIDKFRRNALIAAASYGHVPVVQLLFSFGILPPCPEQIGSVLIERDYEGLPPNGRHLLEQHAHCVFRKCALSLQLVKKICLKETGIPFPKDLAFELLAVAYGPRVKTEFRNTIEKAVAPESISKKRSQRSGYKPHAKKQKGT